MTSPRSRKRRGPGEGSIRHYETKQGLRYGIVYRKPNPESGKTRQVTQSGFTTRAAASKALRERLTEVERGQHVDRSICTLRAFVEQEWLVAMSTQIRTSTWASYERNLRIHVLPTLGDLPLQRLQAAQVTALLARLSTSGRANASGTHPGLSPRTVSYISTILKSALDYAVEQGVLVANPAARVRAPKASASGNRHEQIHTWPKATLSDFLRKSVEHPHHGAWLLLATTGMRRGEVLGLRWQDIDLDAGHLRVVRALVDVEDVTWRPIFSDPKTNAGRRQVALDSTTVRLLRSIRKTRAANRLLFGPGYTDLDLVFALPDGRPLHVDRFSRTFVNTVKKFGLPTIRLHDLRHTWATLALEAGVHPRVVQERLGHSNVSITLGIYSHVSATMASDAAEKVASLIFADSSPLCPSREPPQTNAATDSPIFAPSGLPDPLRLERP